jgi:threonine/homoserine/homoserine lactone efflux protein
MWQTLGPPTYFPPQLPRSGQEPKGVLVLFGLPSAVHHAVGAPTTAVRSAWRHVRLHRFTVMFAYALAGARAIRFLRTKGVLWLDRICGGALLALAGSLAL